MRANPKVYPCFFGASPLHKVLKHNGICYLRVT